MQASPLQIVKDTYGGRSQLVDKIVALHEGGDSDETRSSLMGTSNKKLLRIYAAVQEVKETHGGRKSLIQKITTARYPKGKPDDGFIRRVEEATPKRLLEIYRQTASK
ncbi:MAG: hypothetical protein ACI9OJ_001456 [Myxococcota bacterium]|jgi:hypothetical protein